MHRSSNGQLKLQKCRKPMTDLSGSANKIIDVPLSVGPSPPRPVKAAVCSQLDYSVDEYMPNLHDDLSSTEKKNMLLMQFKAIKDKANKENIEEHPNRCVTLRNGQTVKVIQMLCQQLNVNYIVRIRAIELYDRLVAVLLDDINASILTLSTQEKEKMKPTLEKETMLRIGSCIQLALKFHFDKDDEDLNIYKLTDLLTANSCEIDSEEVKQSEIRVYMSLNHRLNFVTSLDLLETLIPIVDCKKLDMKNIYRLCIKILDFMYIAHGKIYKRLFESKTCASPLNKGYPVKMLESNVVLRSAVALTSALFLMDSKEDRSKAVADLCSIPHKIVANFGSIIIDELLLK